MHAEMIWDGTPSSAKLTVDYKVREAADRVGLFRKLNHRGHKKETS